MTDTATPPLAPRPAGPRPKRAPSPVLERLFALYPRMFGARFLPLKLGVYQELLALHPDDFKKEAVRLTETSGRTVAQVADDLGVGLSSLTRCGRLDGKRGSDLTFFAQA